MKQGFSTSSFRGIVNDGVVGRMAAGRDPFKPPYRLCGFRREESPGSEGRGDG